MKVKEKKSTGIEREPKRYKVGELRHNSEYMTSELCHCEFLLLLNVCEAILYLFSVNMRLPRLAEFTLNEVKVAGSQ